MTRLTIGQVARRAEVGVETVRFYERRGLVPEPPRSPSGYRLYPEDTVARLRFIHRAKELGFSLKEVEELISHRFDGSACAADVKRRAEEKVRDIDRRIRDLQRMRRSLCQLAEACTGRGSTEECSILGALAGAETGDGGTSRPPHRESRGRDDEARLPGVRADSRRRSGT